MKKLLFLLLLLAVVVGTRAQTTEFISLRFATGVYDPDKKEWTYTEFRPAHLTFTWEKNYIAVNDKARSVYKLLEMNVYDKGTPDARIIFEAVDERSKSCKIKLQYNQNTESRNLTVFYGYNCIVYDLEN